MNSCIGGLMDAVTGHDSVASDTIKKDAHDYTSCLKKKKKSYLAFSFEDTHPTGPARACYMNLGREMSKSFLNPR